MMSLLKALVGTVRMPGIAWSFSRRGCSRRKRNFDPAELSDSLAGKQLAVTGGNSGIGFAIASAWAKRDADVWLLCRDHARGQAARDQLAREGNGTIHLAIVDIADFASIDRFVESLVGDKKNTRLDALVHNAGALIHEYIESVPGIESTFACHVAGPHRLTRGLLPALERAEDPRVVFVSSGGMYSDKLSVTDLVSPKMPFDGVHAYALAKRAQVELTQCWASRFQRVRFYAMHPGWVDTPGVERALPGFYRRTKNWLRTTEQGADTAVWLSCVPTLSLPSGAFVFDRQQAPQHILPGTKATPVEIESLWNTLESLSL